MWKLTLVHSHFKDCFVCSLFRMHLLRQPAFSMELWMGARNLAEKSKWICSNSHAPNTFSIWIFGVRGTDDRESESKPAAVAITHVRADKRLGVRPSYIYIINDNNIRYTIRVNQFNRNAGINYRRWQNTHQSVRARAHIHRRSHSRSSHYT